MRTNIYKEKILKLLSKNHLLSISDIHKKISGVDYSTVYRNIEQLVSNEEIKKVVLDKDRVMYEINNQSHDHDHFICNDCGSISEIHNPISKSKEMKGYKITDVLVRGFCKECS